MQLIAFAGRGVFLDDESAHCLVEYASLLGAHHMADAVRIRAVGQDGNVVTASFVLNSATNLMAESTRSDLQPPRNDEAVSYMRARIDQLRSPVEASPWQEVPEDGFYLDDEYG